MSTSEQVSQERAATGMPARWPWISLVLRLALAGIFLFAGAPKLTQLETARMSVRAYEIFPYDVANLIGTFQPVFEVALGLLLLVGLFTRVGAVVSFLLMVIFIAGISSAWARGLSIDCGCFSKGGAIAENATRYPQEIARDVVFAGMAAVLAWRPRSRFSADGALWG